jgi:hypothetical protein
MVREEINQDIPFYRVSCDLIHFEEGYNGDEFVTHSQDFASGFNLILTTP